MKNRLPPLTDTAWVTGRGRLFDVRCDPGQNQNGEERPEGRSGGGAGFLVNPGPGGEVSPSCTWGPRLRNLGPTGGQNSTAPARAFFVDAWVFVQRAADTAARSALRLTEAERCDTASTSLRLQPPALAPRTGLVPEVAEDCPQGPTPVLGLVATARTPTASPAVLRPSRCRTGKGRGAGRGP